MPLLGRTVDLLGIPLDEHTREVEELGPTRLSVPHQLA
jgi:hypothetical protein